MLALQAGGVSAADASFTAAKLDNRNGLDYYEVDFTANGQSYGYDIDALTGAVIESRTPNAEQPAPDIEALSTATPDSSPSTGDDTPENAQSASSEQPSTTPQTTTQPAPAADASKSPVQSTGISSKMLTAEQALSKALAHAGLGNSEATLVKNKLDYKKGRQVYEIEFYTGSSEYDYEIDAYTGEIVSFDHEVKDDASSASSGSTITAKQAKELALARVPGATAADITKFKTDYDDGRTEYEGKIVYDGMEYEFEIDGYSGAFRSWESKPSGR